MELYIIVVGLFMIAERGPDGPVDLLFLQAKDFEDACGAPMAEHRLALKHWIPVHDGLGSIEEILHGAVEISVEISPGAPTSLERNQWEELLDLSVLTKDPRIRSDCQGPDAFSTCKSDGKPLLAARMRLAGGSLSPIDYHPEHELDLPSGLARTVEQPWSFSRVYPLPANDGNPSEPTPNSAEGETDEARRLFNGILYQTRVSADANVTLHWGPHPVSLDPVGKKLCQKLGSPGDCRIALIYNIPTHTHEENADKDCLILSKKKNERCSIDRHFNLNYLLLRDQPSADEALIPVRCIEPKGGEQPGQSRCIPPKTSY